MNVCVYIIYIHSAYICRAAAVADAACVRACVCVCVRACMRACVCACVCACSETQGSRNTK
jgi:hypothetical protein